jgi:hypothetical protein
MNAWWKRFVRRHILDDDPSERPRIKWSRYDDPLASLKEFMTPEELIRYMTLLTPEEHAYRDRFLQGIEWTLRRAAPKHKAYIMRVAETYDVRPGYKSLQEALKAARDRRRNLQ